MLQQARLLASLQTFCDAAYSGFTGFPDTRTQARERWAQAFADYISVIEEAIARPPPAPDTHPSLDLSGLESAFLADLGLDLTLSAAAAAADFAGAWQQGILAISPTMAGATDSASAIYKLGSFTNVASLHDTLRDRLAALFRSPSRSAAARLDEIASAFHDATGALMAAMTKTVGTTTSSVTVGVR